jgi:hypothetical protein
LIRGTACWLIQPWVVGVVNPRLPGHYHRSGPSNGGVDMMGRVINAFGVAATTTMRGICGNCRIRNDELFDETQLHYSILGNSAQTPKNRPIFDFAFSEKKRFKFVVANNDRYIGVKLCRLTKCVSKAPG